MGVPSLGELKSDAEAVIAEAERLRSELSNAQLEWPPGPGRWSVAGCFEHLRVTGGLYYPKMREALERARDRDLARRKPFRPRPFARWFIRLASPGSAKRLKAPKRYHPVEDRAGASALDDFVEQQAELLGLIDEAGDADLNRPRFGSPITRLLRFSTGEGLLLMVRHQQRHLAQALRVLEEDAFPTE